MLRLLAGGHNAQVAVNPAAKIAGVSKALLADAPQLKAGLAENIEATVTTRRRSLAVIRERASDEGEPPGTDLGENHPLGWAFSGPR